MNAGARACVGLKAGRYMFEVMIGESKSPAEPANSRAMAPKPKQLVRVGLATAASSLFLGDGADSSVFFDSRGVTKGPKVVRL